MKVNARPEHRHFALTWARERHIRTSSSSTIDVVAQITSEIVFSLCAWSSHVAQSGKPSTIDSYSLRYVAEVTTQRQRNDVQLADNALVQTSPPARRALLPPKRPADLTPQFCVVVAVASKLHRNFITRARKMVSMLVLAPSLRLAQHQNRMHARAKHAQITPQSLCIGC